MSSLPPSKLPREANVVRCPRLRPTVGVGGAQGAGICQECGRAAVAGSWYGAHSDQLYAVRWLQCAWMP